MEEEIEFLDTISTLVWNDISKQELVEMLKDRKQELEKQLTIHVVVEPFYCDVIVGEEGYRCRKQCKMCKGFPK